MAYSTPKGNIAQQYQRSNWWNQPQAQQTDPYADFNNEMAQYVAQLRAGIGAPGSGGVGGSEGTGIFSTHVARPGDAAVQEYLDAKRSEQKRVMDEYVNRAATATVNRGGVNVAGGPNLGASGFMEGTRAIASGAGSAFDTAMNYNKYVEAQKQEQSRYLANMLNSAIGTRLQGIQGSAGFAGRRGDQMREDWQYDSGQAYDQWKNAGNMARQNQQAGMQLNQQQLAGDRSEMNQNRLQQLMTYRPTASPANWATSTNELLRANGTIPNKYYGGYGGRG